MRFSQFSGTELSDAFGCFVSSIAINVASVCSVEDLGELVAVNVHSGQRYLLKLPFAEVKARLGLVDEYHLKVSR
jgi:hypothetical protein